MGSFVFSNGRFDLTGQVTLPRFRHQTLLLFDVIPIGSRFRLRETVFFWARVSGSGFSSPILSKLEPVERERFLSIGDAFRII